jgi:hypothetical protein
MIGPMGTAAGIGNSNEASQPGPPGRGVADRQLPFFDVSLPKLAVLSVCSLGIYEMYWFYKNWQIVRARERSDISPLWRAGLGFIFCYAMFKRVREYDAQTGGSAALPAGALAAGWIVVTCLWQLPDRYSLAANLSCLFMLPVQAAANRINGIADPRDRNTRFTLWNWLTVALGGTVLVLDALGVFAVPEPG